MLTLNQYFVHRQQIEEELRSCTQLRDSSLPLVNDRATWVYLETGNTALAGKNREEYEIIHHMYMLHL